jgi:hypothetical protein
VEQINTTCGNKTFRPWNKNPRTQISKIPEQKLQKSRNKNYKNPGTKVTKITKIQEQSYKNWEQKSRNKS